MTELLIIYLVGAMVTLITSQWCTSRYRVRMTFPLFFLFTAIALFSWVGMCILYVTFKRCEIIEQNNCQVDQSGSPLCSWDFLDESEIKKGRYSVSVDIGGSSSEDSKTVKDKLINNDLEAEIEMVRKYHYVNGDFEKALFDGRTISNIAHHFANWQKKQMIRKISQWLDENVPDWIDMSYDQKSFVQKFKNFIKED